MFRAFVTVSVLAGLAVAGVVAQTATDLTASTPQENAAGGSVSLRAPSTWVRAAITRHSGLQGLRLTGPRFGQPNTEEATARFSGNATTASTTTGGLGGLLDLLNQLGGTGSLSNLVSGLTGGTTGSTTGATIPAPSNGSNYTLADLIALGQSVGSTQKTNNPPLATLPVDQATAKTGPVTQTRNSITYGGAIARLPKPEDIYQQTQTTTSQPTTSFGTRWMTAMADTFFAAIALGMQSDAFVTALENALRPLVLPTASNTSGSGTDSGSGSSTDSGSGSGSNGGGIENLSSPTGNNGSSGSTI